MPPEIQANKTETKPVAVVSVLGKPLGEVAVYSAFGDVVDSIVTDSSFILPLNDRVAAHNMRAQEIHGSETTTLKIVDHTVLSFEGVSFRFNATQGNIKGGLINMLLAVPGAKLSVPDLKTVIANRVGQTITGFSNQFSKPPLLRDRGAGATRVVGLCSNVVVEDMRTKPTDALVLAQKNLASKTEEEKQKSKKVGELTVRPTQFVSNKELADALEEDRFVRITDVGTLNKLTRQFMNERRGGLEPNVVSIIDDIHMQINGEAAPVGPRAIHFFNHLLASYMGQPRSVEQIFSPDAEPERQTVESFLRQISHKKWFRGYLIDGKECLVLEPAIIIDRRPKR